MNYVTHEELYIFVTMIIALLTYLRFIRDKKHK